MSLYFAVYTLVWLVVAMAIILLALMDRWMFLAVRGAVQKI